MRFAYIFKSSQDGIVHHASIRSGSSTSDVYSVHSFALAGELAKKLVEQGVDCIELCGAFAEEGKQQVVDAISCDVPVGHVVYTGSEANKHDRLFKRC